ncbi:MAG: DUF4386 domain-containing protein [Gemmatimonadota bacterium]|nr:DUF4386 domain-containing protein [Gemmatimonadota bacterium]
MSPERRSAATVGILFIVATGAYLVGQSMYAPITGSTEYLELAYPHRTRVIAGILVELLGVLAIPLIALLFYPLLRGYHEQSALGYIGIRILEAVGLLGATIIAWATVDVSQGFGLSEASSAVAWDVFGGGLQAVGESTFLISVAVVFPIGALLLNWILWRFRLVPRLISGWGLLAAGILLGGSLLDFAEILPPVSPVLLEGVLSGPIALQEMVLAGWLITKGLATAAPVLE